MNTIGKTKTEQKVKKYFKLYYILYVVVAVKGFYFILWLFFMFVEGIIIKTINLFEKIYLIVFFYTKLFMDVLLFCVCGC